MGRRNKIDDEWDDENGTSFLSAMTYVLILCAVILVIAIILALWP